MLSPRNAKFFTEVLPLAFHHDHPDHVALSSRRTTQKDVAHRLGLHPSTISLALRNHPSIPGPTRQRVAAEARILGYRADPYLTALLHYKQRKRRTEKSFRGLLVCLDYGSGYWLSTPETLARLKAYCTTLDHRLEIIQPAECGFSAARLNSMLDARAAVGVLIACERQPIPWVELDWSRRAAVAVGPPFGHAPTHAFSSNLVADLQTAVARLREAGWTRWKLILPARASFGLTEAVLVQSVRHGAHGLSGGQILLRDPSEVASLFERAEPFACVTTSGSIARALRSSNAAVSTITIGSASVNDEGQAVCGVEPVARAALDFLVKKASHADYGLPLTPLSIQVPGAFRAAK